MKITDVTTTELFYPDVPAWEDSSGLSPGGKGQIFVHLKTDVGIEGLGVGQASPGVRDVVERGLKGLLLDKDPFNIEKLWDEMFRAVRFYGGNGIALYALSAIDIGLWDLKSKALDLPLYRLLGVYAEEVPIYGSGGWTHYSSGDLINEMTGYLERGVKRVKMKVGKARGRCEREDIERVAAVRKAVGDDVALYVDANNAYYAKQATYMAAEFERSQIGWFEKPVTADDVRGLVEVRRASHIPVASGDLESSQYDFRELLSRGAVDIVQVDVGRVGGVTAWQKVAHLAQAFNVPITTHGFEQVSLHLGCATRNLKAVEELKIDRDVDEIWYTEIPGQRAGMAAPFEDRPGLGLELDPYAVEKWSI